MTSSYEGVYQVPTPVQSRTLVKQNMETERQIYFTSRISNGMIKARYIKDPPD